MNYKIRNINKNDCQYISKVVTIVWNEKCKEFVIKAKEQLKKKIIISCLKGNKANDFYKHIGGIYIKNRVFKKLNLLENISYFEI